MYSLTKVQFLVLAVLVRHPMHLYAIRQEIIELTDHTYYPTGSTVKQATDALLKREFLEECYSNPHYWLKARRGVPYELTALGRRRIKREIEVYFRLCQMVRSYPARPTGR